MAGNGKRGAGQAGQRVSNGGAHRGKVQAGGGVGGQGRAEKVGAARRKQRNDQVVWRRDKRESLGGERSGFLRIYNCNIDINSSKLQLFQKVAAYIYTT